MTLPASAKTMSFIVTRDRDRARAFYGDLLGLAKVHEDDFAIVYDMNGTQLRISTLKEFQPQAHTVLGWEVPEIVAVVKALRSKGVTFTVYDGMGQDELGIWTVPGSKSRVAWFLDPDGNNLSMTQF
jgi:catechol 2,3-dioxygenase-like lactoylglutathione lyase family enzyme